jgi:hypothetical protein
MVSQLVYTLAGETFQFRELRNELMLPSTNAFKELLSKSWQKRGGYVLRILFYRSHDKKNHTTNCSTQ